MKNPEKLENVAGLKEEQGHVCQITIDHQQFAFNVSRIK